MNMEDRQSKLHKIYLKIERLEAYLINKNELNYQGFDTRKASNRISKILEREQKLALELCIDRDIAFSDIEIPF